MASLEGKVFDGFQVTNKPISKDGVEFAEGKNTTSGDRCLIKLEAVSRVSNNKIPNEAKVHRGLVGKAGIQNVLFAGPTPTHNVLVLEPLGNSLESLLNKQNNKKLSLKTVLTLGDQMLSLLEYVHGRGFIHRNISLQNFAMGFAPESKQLYLTEFGHAKRYLDPKTKVHVPYRDRRPVDVQSVMYLSVNAHNGIEQARRDDIESLCYVLIHLLKGDLPWLDIKSHTSEEVRRKVRERKAAVTPNELCQGIPTEFAQMLSYARGMFYDHKPDYKMLHSLMRTLFLKSGYSPDFVFDWTSPAVAAERQGNSRFLSATPDLQTPEISPAQSEAPSENGDAAEQAPSVAEIVISTPVKPGAEKKKKQTTGCASLFSCFARAS